MKFCVHCGSQLSETERFCRNCGAPVSGETPNVQQPQMNQGYQQPQMNQGYQQPQMNQGYQQNQQAPMYQAAAPGVAQKSKMAAGLLGVFLGGWGAHNFYLGYTGKAVAQLVLTIFTCGVASLWGFIEGILIFTGSINTDAKGNPLGD